jgi:hypothetical protein
VCPTAADTFTITYQNIGREFQVKSRRHAKAKWGSVSFPAGGCGNKSPVTTPSIDDVHILVLVGPLDNVEGRNSAAAGYCLARTTPGGLPYLGHVLIDEFDVPAMVAGKKVPF